MFWDTSAIVPLVVPEATSAMLSERFDADVRTTTWWATPVEAHGALARAVRDQRISRQEAVAAAERLTKVRAGFDEVWPSDDVRRRAMRLLSVHRLRASDALQLAAALIWCEEQPSGETFVCLDKRLRDAARREGFTLLPPDYADRAK